MTTDRDVGERYWVAGLAASVAAPAPFVVILLGAVSNGDVLGAAAALFFVMLFGVPIAFAHFLVLGLPTYLLLRRFRRPGWLVSMLAGMLIGALPLGLVSGGASGLEFGAACGLAAGLTFWLILQNMSPPAPPGLDAKVIFG